jgi:hypothetical protein
MIYSRREVTVEYAILRQKSKLSEPSILRLCHYFQEIACLHLI